MFDFFPCRNEYSIREDSLQESQDIRKLADVATEQQDGVACSAMEEEEGCGHLSSSPQERSKKPVVRCEGHMSGKRLTQ